MPSICRSALSALALALISSTGVSAQNLDCTLQLPANPLSAAGLATPYILAGKTPPITTTTAGPCNQALFIQRTFVQGAIIDPATGAVTLYDPLVIDMGTTAAVTPVAPVLPANAVVGLWFGNNANTLTLLDTVNPGALAAGNCVNGLLVNGVVNVFGEYAYCNAPAWFKAANMAIAAGKLVVPPLGVYNVPAGANTPTAALPAGTTFVPTQVPAQANVPCPSVRSFAIIDQDQSDNMVTSYLLTAAGATAQDNAANRATLNFGAAGGATQIVNASDNRLVSVALDGALGCKPFTAPDLVAGVNNPSFPLNELSAAAKQQPPVALVPANDPMTLLLGTTTQSLAKVNLYRAGVDQPPANNLAKIAGTSYCLNYGKAAPTRIIMDSPLTIKATSPVPAVGDTLFTFMVGRMNAAWPILGCDKLLATPLPFTAVVDGNGVVIAGNINPAFTTALAAFIAQQAAAKAAAAAAAKAAAQAAAAAAAKAAAAKAAAAKAAAATAATPAAKAAAAKAAAAAAATPAANAANVAALSATAQKAQAVAAAAVQAAAANPSPAASQAAVVALQASQKAQAALSTAVAAQQTTSAAVADSADLVLADEGLDYMAEDDAYDVQDDMMVPDVVDISAIVASSDYAALTSNMPTLDAADAAASSCAPAADSNGFSSLWFGVGAASMMGLVAVAGSGLALARRKIPGLFSSERDNMQTIHAAQSDSV